MQFPRFLRLHVLCLFLNTWLYFCQAIGRAGRPIRGFAFVTTTSVAATSFAATSITKTFVAAASVAATYITGGSNFTGSSVSPTLSMREPLGAYDGFKVDHVRNRIVVDLIIRVRDLKRE